jgi:uncharacterized repeat protein (TIGR02543 family)
MADNPMRIFCALIIVFGAALSSVAQTAPINIAIVGKGLVKGATNNHPLTLDKAYTLTATPAAGFVFRGWSGSTNTTKSSFSFRMAPEFAITATFEDITRPGVVITSPKSNQRFLAPNFNITGTARDNDRIKAVRLRQNGGEWFLANGSNSWNGPITFTPGLNKLEAVATDFADRNSTTSAVTVTYAVCEPVQFNVDGPGKIAPTIASCYEIGKTYTVTAVPKAGCVFDGWTGSSNTVSRSLKFVMRSGVAYTAHFRDIAKPTIRVTNPSKGSLETTNSQVTIRGTVADNVSVARVFWNLNGGQWIEANRVAAGWDLTTGVEPGPNRIRVYTEDSSGNLSATNQVSVMSVRELARVYHPLTAGNRWTYLAPFGRITKEVFDRGDGSFSIRDPSDGAETFYKYNADLSQLLMAGAKADVREIAMLPPIAELDAKTLAHGGSTTISAVVLAKDPTSATLPEFSFSMRTTFKATPVSSVTVPAGTFTDCRRIDISASAYVPTKGWQSFSTQSYIVAPNVGPIQIGLYRRLTNGSFQFGGWEYLENATIDGNPIGLAPAIIPPRVVVDGPLRIYAWMDPQPTISTNVINVPPPAPATNSPNDSILSGPFLFTAVGAPAIPGNPPGAVTFQSMAPRPVAARLEARGFSNGAFVFVFSAEQGKTYQVQRSEDLVNWSAVTAEFTAQDDDYEVTDSVGRQRFYRVVAKP